MKHVSSTHRVSPVTGRRSLLTFFPRITDHGSRISLFLVGLALVCCATLPAQAAAKPPVDYKALPKLTELKEKQPAPDFVLPRPDGTKVALKDFRGKVVVLAFWATWCEYCREELPAMERLYRDYRGKGLEVVAINMKDRREDALAFVKRAKLSYPVLMDPEGEIGSLYGAYATPTVYLIDRKGVALARLWGPGGWNGPAARKLIGALLEQ